MGAAAMSLPKTEPRQLDSEQIERLIRVLERIARTVDEYCGADLNARYPHGKPTDRWGRSA
jgi:hypothetical protein